MRAIWAPIALTVVLALVASCDSAPVEHVVVLMLENRAFDHLIGWMKQDMPQVNGLDGQQSNPVDPTDPFSARVFASDQAKDVDADPGHEFYDTTVQVFGTPFGQPPGEDRAPLPAPMDGFILSAMSHIANETQIMDCHAPKNVPVFASLAKNFALFDHYFSSMPGPTQLNRLFYFSATTHGSALETAEDVANGWPQPSFFDQFEAENITWRNYFDIVPSPCLLSSMRKLKYLDNFRFPVLQFERDALVGDLPQFTFIDPNYASDYVLPSNDCHPSHSVSEAEWLVKRVYEALRISPLWEKSMLVLNFDEHGGFFDHVPTPTEGVPNPDGIMSTNPPFEFDRLGVRVPMMVISPWVDAQVVHSPPEASKPHNTSQFEHTSVMATVRKLFNMTSPPLTHRDAWAATFEFVLNRTTPRTDCPIFLPTPSTGNAHKVFTAEPTQRINGLQRSFMSMARGMTGHGDEGEHLRTELEAATWMRARMREWKAGKGVYHDGKQGKRK